MSATGEDRLTALEELTAHQAQTIDELNAEVTRQGDQLQRLEKSLTVLAKRMIALEESATPDTPSSRPPHW